MPKFSHYLCHNLIIADVERIIIKISGVFYLVALHANDIPSQLRVSDQLKGNVSMEKRCDVEHLYILRFVRI